VALSVLLAEVGITTTRRDLSRKDQLLGDPSTSKVQETTAPSDKDPFPSLYQTRCALISNLPISMIPAHSSSTVIGMKQCNFWVIEYSPFASLSFPLICCCLRLNLQRTHELFEISCSQYFPKPRRVHSHKIPVFYFLLLSLVVLTTTGLSHNTSSMSEESRSLTDEQSSALKNELAKIINGADAADLIDYILAMVVNGKEEGYIVQELKDMDMEVCNGTVSDQVGNLLGEFYKALDDVSPDAVKEVPTEMPEESSPKVETSGEDASGKKVTSFKKTSAKNPLTTSGALGAKKSKGNALTMSGALGAARKGDKSVPKEKEAPKNIDKKNERKIQRPDKKNSDRGGRESSGGRNDRGDRNDRGGRNDDRGGRSFASEAFKRLAQQRDRDPRDRHQGRGPNGRSDRGNDGGRHGRGRDTNNGRGRDMNRGGRDMTNGRGRDTNRGGRGAMGRGIGRGIDHSGGRDNDQKRQFERDDFGSGGRSGNGRGHDQNQNKRARLQNDNQQQQQQPQQQQENNGVEGNAEYQTQQEDYGYNEGYGYNDWSWDNSGYYYDQYYDPYYDPSSWRGGGRQFGRGRGRNSWGRGGGRGRGQEGANATGDALEADKSGANVTDPSTLAAAEASPSPLVAAEFSAKLSYSGGGRGRSFRGGRGRGRGRGRGHVAAKVASMSWSRSKAPEGNQNEQSGQEATEQS